MMKTDFTYSMKIRAIMTHWATTSIKTALMQWAANMIKKGTISNRRRRTSRAIITMTWRTMTSMKSGTYGLTLTGPRALR